jgi:hypothetical protein
MEQTDRICPFLNEKCDSRCAFYGTEHEESTDSEGRLRDKDIGVCNLNALAVFATHKLRKELNLE